MTAQPDRHSRRDAERSMHLLKELFADYWPRSFAIRLWDGSGWEADRGMPAHFTLVINHPSALHSMLSNPRELSLAEAYIYKEIDVEGDIHGIFPLADHLIDKPRTIRQRLRLAAQLFRLPFPKKRPVTGRQAACLDGDCHSRQRDRLAVTYHYDVSNDFYALWLDRRMNYSCAYFERPDDDLDRTQERKLDYICRKLRLRRGERLLDIGCGWGGLLMHAAARYGAEARGITLSREQAGLAQERISKNGLGKRCSVEVCDYRDVSDHKGFDKMVSVGMFEHVGRRMLPEYFRKAWSLLKPGGVFLNHGIAANPLWPDRPGPTFTDRYVFPDGDLLPLSTTLTEAEKSGFEVRDVESLREHYPLTLRQWVRRLEEKASEACRATDETTFRIWRLYMAASAHGFATGRLSVYQALLVKPNNGRSNLPLTRADWYVRNI